ncbi:mechanosensitive ion channel family protein [uncultured Algimonas sp.]|uniref:mechanosensitive ion channel family protein n=1 Tax=uncultured Algimonas sp. TaxID=1547920 RepID=UPI00261FD9B1|nr:mechanosensitive ion channel family protein [uncultured Algimonas sp.]
MQDSNTQNSGTQNSGTQDSGNQDAATSDDTINEPLAEGFSLEAAMDRVESWAEGFISILPNLVLAALILLLFWWLASLAKKQLAKRFRNHERPSLGQALGRLAKIFVIVIGIAIAIAVVAPSVKLSTLIGSLGVGSVAIGFAFKDILQNWLAGMLILLRQPFQIGDQIEAAGFEGTVESIETRATILKTYEGEHAIIPNSELYTNSVLVKTKTSISRGEYTIGVSYDADIDQVLELIEQELSKIEEISDDPPPEAHTWELGDSSVNILARWWTKAEKAEQVRIRGRAVRAVKLALDKAGIEIPYPHLVSVKPSGPDKGDDTEAKGEDRDKAGDSA